MFAAGDNAGNSGAGGLDRTARGLKTFSPWLFQPRQPQSGVRRDATLCDEVGPGTFQITLFASSWELLSAKAARAEIINRKQMAGNDLNISFCPGGVR